MKLLLLYVTILIGVFLVHVDVASAHPGGLSDDGAHYCWTNCESWGEVYGERHCHQSSWGCGYEYEYIPEPDYLYEEDPEDIDGTYYDYEQETYDSYDSYNYDAGDEDTSGNDADGWGWIWWVGGGVLVLIVLSEF